MKPALIAAFVAAAIGALYISDTDGRMPAESTDWAMYVMHTRNIVNGRAYADTGFVAQAEAAKDGSSYPSGYPLALAPIYAVSGFNIGVFKIFTDIALALSLWLVFILARRSLPWLQALLIVVMLAFSYEYLSAQNNVNTEGLYQVILYASLLFALWVYDQNKDEAQPILWGLLLGAACGFAYITRSFGVALPIAIGLFDLFRRRRISLFIVCVLAGFVPVVLADGLLLPKGASYSGQFVWSPAVIAGHVVNYVGLYSYLFRNPHSQLLRYALWLPALFLTFWGLWTTWSSLRKSSESPSSRVTVVDFYPIVLMGILFVYWWPDSRYLFSVYPVLLIYLFRGCNALLLRIPSSWRQPVKVAGAVALLAVPFLNFLDIRNYPKDSLVTINGFQQLMEAVKTKTGSSEYFVFWNPRVFSLYTGRPTSSYPSETGAKVGPYLDKIQPNYVVLEKTWNTDRQFLKPAIDARPDHYRKIYENPEFELYQVADAPDRRANPPAPIR